MNVSPGVNLQSIGDRFDDAVAALERIADALESIAIAFDRQQDEEEAE